MVPSVSSGMAAGSARVPSGKLGDAEEEDIVVPELGRPRVPFEKGPDPRHEDREDGTWGVTSVR